jgi:hypothetical protein
MGAPALGEPIRASSRPDRSRLASKGVDGEGLSVAALAALDRVLDLLRRRELSTTELRVLLQLVDGSARLAELAPELGQPPVDVRSAARSLASRGLVRWLHAGDRKQTQLEITPIGLTTAATFLGATVQAPGDTDPAEVNSP